LARGLLVLASTLSVTAAAADPSADPRCRDVVAVDAVDVWSAPCAASRRRRCRGLALRVVRGAKRRVTWLTVTVDQRLEADLRAELGPCAPLGLRAVAQLLRALAAADRRQRRQLRPTLRRLRRLVPYALRPGVRISPQVELRLQELAGRFYRRARRQLVVTSGVRDAASQARAMYVKLRLGARIVRLYRQKEAARQIVRAYRAARRARHTRRQTVAALRAVIERQICRGVLISDHLRAGAVDLRSRGMGRRGRRIFRRVVAGYGRSRWLKEERRPPHFHLAFRDVQRELPRPSYCRPPASAPGAR